MWPKYAFLLGWFSEPYYQATFDCDFTLPQNVDSDLFQTCYVNGLQQVSLSDYPVALQRAAQITDESRGQFAADPAVESIGAAMND